MEDSILISQLELHSNIGVPPSERAAPQRLAITLRLFPQRPLTALSDNLANTVDYAAVCEAVRSEAQSKPRHLLETLAEDIATLLLNQFPLRSIEIDLRKYILPSTEYVSVQVRRSPPSTP